MIFNSSVPCTALDTYSKCNAVSVEFYIRKTCGFFTSGSTEGLDEACHEPNDRQIQPQYRANTTVHVCWHRMISVGGREHQVTLQVRSSLDVTSIHCDIKIAGFSCSLTSNDVIQGLE